VWFGELDTNKGGEFRAGYEQSLLQGLAIDKRRADLIKAQIARRAAEPEIYKARIEFMRAAAISYWNWVAEGRKYVISSQILKTALERDKQLQLRANIEDISPIDVLDNRRIIYDRQARLIGNSRKFQESAIKLSLFFRDSNGIPAVPDTKRLPRVFPQPEPFRPDRLSEDIAIALRNRPELRELALKRESVNVSLQLARNQILPKLDAYTLASQDVGQEVDLGNKTPFVFEAGLQGGVPIQRSAARGAIRTNRALLAQLIAQTRWIEDKISTDVQAAMAALAAAVQQLEPARQAVQVTYKVEVAEREKWKAGDSSLFVVNLRELATADAAAVEVEALANYFVALADYRAALGVDGLNYQRVAPAADP
jgi:outer membrane protein TolC